MLKGRRGKPPHWRLEKLMKRQPGLTRRQAAKIVAQVDAERHQQKYGVACQQLQEVERLLSCVQGNPQTSHLVLRIVEVRNKVYYIREECMGDATAMEDAKAAVLRRSGRTTSRLWARGVFWCTMAERDESQPKGDRT